MNFDWSSIWAAWPDLMAGSWMTLKITAMGLLGGVLIGGLCGIVVTYIEVPVNRRNGAWFALALIALVAFLNFGTPLLGAVPGWVAALALAAAAVALLWRHPQWIARCLSMAAQVFILLVRGTPIVVQVMFIYFALPLMVNLRIDGLTAAVVTLMINSGAYIAEIVRAGLLSVPKGLYEAGQAMGLPFHKIMAFIIGPVALRRMIPTMGNQCIISLKDSSLFIVIGVSELTRQGQEIIATNFRAVEIWGTVAVIYLVMTGCIALALKVIEHRTRMV